MTNFLIIIYGVIVIIAIGTFRMDTEKRLERIDYILNNTELACPGAPK